jgi:hypothetical protein
MDRRRGGQVAGPGVEDTHQAERPTEVMGVPRQGLQGSRGGLQKQVGQAARVRTGHRTPCLG